MNHKSVHQTILDVTYGVELVETGEGYLKYKGIIDRTLLPQIQAKLDEKGIAITLIDIDYDNRHSIVRYSNQPNEAPSTLRGGHLLPLLRRERNPSEAEISSHSFASSRARFSAKGDKPSLSSLSAFKHQLDSLKSLKKLKDLSKLIPTLPQTDRVQAGKLLNEAKQKLTNYKLQATSYAPQASSWLDPTIPGLLPPVGHLHPVTQAIAEIEHIFTGIGFTRVRYPEVDWDWYTFESLNFPDNHPARDDWETFFVDAPNHPKKGPMLLIPHTSSGQVREMERLGNPPIRMINIAKCYRRQHDLTHTAMFHQFEGLVVDRGINIQHLKGTIDYFARHFYGPKSISRLRPFHFQFTEPSFEVDFSCTMCDGKGCKFCKSGWHEVGGAGMVHPNVLKAGGIDPSKYTGFAFGWGIERTYTLKPGLKLNDIRLLYNNNLEFLSQF